MIDNILKLKDEDNNEAYDCCKKAAIEAYKKLNGIEKPILDINNREPIFKWKKDDGSYITITFKDRFNIAIRSNITEDKIIYDEGVLSNNIISILGRYFPNKQKI